ncbi:TetR/AcrR family transcriptional regulator [Actinomadura algeriensis]|uniref:AcrR family transcriptional regulator n=1 Tax=Actinomadura algeriensis TaxID=1679523 RepID=A0ABR9JP13_9ACTN|nr:TetR/AcrR family transcriptional regulator [Actinomadura algeriensis]MBE1532311.1 AcrR family transcriptional regulator [Actinomadura algeriensis]
MRSVDDDRSTRAIIRDEALRLFAVHGPDRVTVRQVGEAAEVSAALVIHHFGSKEVLRETVDRHVLSLLESMLDDLAADPGAADARPGPSERGAPASLADALLRRLPPDSPVPAYLARLLPGDDPAGARLFRRLYEAARRHTPSADRAAFLLVNDLAVILLRHRIADVLGTDPLSREGLARWTAEAMTVYERGIG